MDDRAIVLYTRNGSYIGKIPLIQGLGECIGNLSLVFVNNGHNPYHGFLDPYRIKTDDFDGTIRDYIVIWKVDGLRPGEHRRMKKIRISKRITEVKIDDIDCIYTIKNSHPRFGGYMANEFYIKGFEKYRRINAKTE